MRSHDVTTTAASVAVVVLAYGCSTTVTASTTTSPPAGCSVNGALDCEDGADGWTCLQGDNPQAEQQGLSCSIAQTDSVNPSEDDFCCIAWTSTNSDCSPDDAVTAACQYPSHAFLCAAGSDPTSLDESLTCGSPVAGADGGLDFCCQ